MKVFIVFIDTNRKEKNTKKERPKICHVVYNIGQKLDRKRGHFLSSELYGHFDYLL